MNTLVALTLSTGLWLWFIRREDRLQPEPLAVMIRLLIVGGLVSTFFAGIFNEIMGAALDVGQMRQEGGLPVNTALVYALFVGFNEEGLKALVTRWRTRNLKTLDEPVDALIYSVTVALGFAAFENLSYMAMHGQGVLVIRSLTAVPVHVGLAAIWGMGLARERFGLPNGLGFWPSVALAALLHAGYDFICFTWQDASPMALTLFALAAGLLLILSLRRKARQLVALRLEQGLGCSKCGAIMPEHAAYCANCGHVLSRIPR